MEFGEGLADLQTAYIYTKRKMEEEKRYKESQRPEPEQTTMKEYGDNKMNEGQGFGLIKSARMGNAVPNKFNVPSQGNHQTAGNTITSPTMPQSTTPGLKPMGGVTSAPTQVQTNMNDRFAQSTTRQVKANYGVGIGPGSGNRQYEVNQHITAGLGGSSVSPYAGYQPKMQADINAFNKGPIGTGVSKLFSAIGKGLKGAFSDNSSPYKKGGKTEVACNDKKGAKFVSGSK